MNRLASKIINVFAGIIASVATIIFGLVLLLVYTFMVLAIVLRIVFVTTKSFFRFFYCNVEVFLETLEDKETTTNNLITPIFMAHRLFWLSLGVLLTIWGNIGDAYERS